MAPCASTAPHRACRASQRDRGGPGAPEIFNGLFMAIAEEMGTAPARSATSVNIRERLDFSCALFDGAGRPGPMRRICRSTSARWAKASRPCCARVRAGADGRGIQRGDAYVLNALYAGGTHLPDITVIAAISFKVSIQL